MHSPRSNPGWDGAPNLAERAGRPTRCPRPIGYGCPWLRTGRAALRPIAGQLGVKAPLVIGLPIGTEIQDARQTSAEVHLERMLGI